MFLCNDMGFLKPNLAKYQLFQILFIQSSPRTMNIINLFSQFFYLIDYVLHILITDHRSRRNTQSILKNLFGYAVGIARSLCEDRLQMHRFPQWAAFYICSEELGRQFITGIPYNGRIYQNAGEPEVG